MKKDDQIVKVEKILLDYDRQLGETLNRHSHEIASLVRARDEWAALLRKLDACTTQKP